MNAMVRLRLRGVCPGRATLPVFPPYAGSAVKVESEGQGTWAFAHADDPPEAVRGIVHGAAEDEYRRIAPYYDRVLNPLLDGLRRTIAATCCAAGAHRVVDVCCGTARQRHFCTESFRMAYVGVDRSSTMLAQWSRAGQVATPAGPAVGSSADAILVQADGARLPFAEHTFDIGLLCFALHEKPEPVAQAMLAETLRVAPLCCAVDYTMAERNMELPGQWCMMIPERLAGRVHWRYYRAFMRRGGMQGFLERAGVSVREHHHIFGGGAGLFLLSS